MTTQATVNPALESHHHGQELWATLRGIIEDDITNDPRSLQTAIGPSGLACPCDRCLIHMLAGHQTVEAAPPWLPAIGRAVHSWLQTLFARRYYATPNPERDARYLPEQRVMVGMLDGHTPVHGSTDLFDRHTGTVIDWKVVGITTLRAYRKTGAPSATYQGQAQCYGKGWEDAGYDVKHVMVVYLPRNGRTLNDAEVWCAPYDRAAANAALARAAQFHTFIQAVGVDAVLAAAPPHTGDEFSCANWPGDTPQNSGTAPAAPVTHGAFAL